MKVVLVLLIVCFVASLQGCIYKRSDSSFQYGQASHGVTPYYWFEVSGFCGTGNDQEHQSPIDIVDSFYSTSMKALNTKYADNITIVSENNGHTVEFSEIESEKPLTLSGGPLSGTYNLVQFHFHWGISAHGSEHYIDGQQASAELHFVHYNSKYSADDVKSHPDGIAVIGVLLKLDESAVINEDYQLVFNAIEGLETPSAESVTTSGLNVNNLLPKDREYFYYAGSLTTPSCNEAVSWIVLREPVYIRQVQLDILQALLYEDGEEMTTVGPNYRPLQARNTRDIYRSFKTDAELYLENEYQSSNSASSVMFSGLLVVFAVFMCLF